MSSKRLKRVHLYVIKHYCISTLSFIHTNFTGVFLAVAAAIYPIGWSAVKVKYYCGPESKAYRIGECELGRRDMK